MNLQCSPFPRKQSMKNPRKNLGNFGTEFGTNFRDENSTLNIPCTFVLQLFWPNDLGNLHKNQPSKLDIVEKREQLGRSQRPNARHLPPILRNTFSRWYCRRGIARRFPGFHVVLSKYRRDSPPCTRGIAPQVRMVGGGVSHTIFSH